MLYKDIARRKDNDTLQPRACIVLQFFSSATYLKAEWLNARMLFLACKKHVSNIALMKVKAYEDRNIFLIFVRQ